jgi:hypothetical protein
VFFAFASVACGLLFPFISRHSNNEGSILNFIGNLFQGYATILVVIADSTLREKVKDGEKDKSE